MRGEEEEMPCEPVGTNPTSANTRMGNSKDLCIKQNSMNKKEADLSQSMKDMLEHGEWQRMKEVKAKSLSFLSSLIQGRKGFFPINSLWWNRRVSFKFLFLLHLDPSNILCCVIIPHYWRARNH